MLYRTEHNRSFINVYLYVHIVIQHLHTNNT